MKYFILLILILKIGIWKVLLHYLQKNIVVLKFVTQKLEKILYNNENKSYLASYNLMKELKILVPNDYKE